MARFINQDSHQISGEAIVSSTGRKFVQVSHMHPLMKHIVLFIAKARAGARAQTGCTVDKENGTCLQHRCQCSPAGASQALQAGHFK